MRLENYRPQSKLVVKTTLIVEPRFPVIDAHNHLGYFGGNWIERPLSEICAALDEVHVTHYVDLDGGWGEDVLQQHLDALQPQAGRFAVFGGVNWNDWQKLGDAFPEAAARRLEAQKSWGASGVKIWKPFGLQVRDPQGRRTRVDDERLDPIWETAGRLNLPVMIHVGDPAAFFDPIDETNERWEELGAHPDWAFTSPPYPPFQQIMNELANLIARHPRTTFIGAHVGCCAENLAWVGDLLDRCPNYFIDISARTAELGRQPYTARKFFLRYADRILFGLDLGPDVENYRISYRFLESDDEYFNYNPGAIPLQGRWQIYGIYLPDDVLKKVYHENARKVLLSHDTGYC